MKKIILITILIGIILLFANCRKSGVVGVCIEYVEYESFARCYSELNKKNGVFFIKGMVLNEYSGGNKIEVMEDLRGNFRDKSHINVWYCSSYPENDTLIMPLRKCEGDHKGISYEYEGVKGGYPILRLSNGYVNGYILSKDDKWLKSLSQKEQASILENLHHNTEIWEWQTMSWDNFQKLLKTIKNTKL